MYHIAPQYENLHSLYVLYRFNGGICVNDNLANLISTAFENTYERASAESTLGEVSEVTNGYAFKSKDLVSVPSDTTKAVFKMGNIQAGGGISHPSTKSWVEPLYFPKEKFLAREGDILMSMTDMKDNVRILGHTALMDRDKQYYVNQRVGIIRATRLPAEYLYPLTNSKDFIQNLRMKANRGVQVNLTTKAIKESIVKVPDAKSLDDYLAIVNPLFDLQKLNSLEIDNLVGIRNEILNRMVH
jgi:type I restriction enzyme S subunit